jgi:hypothetical protein
MLEMTMCKWGQWLRRMRPRGVGRFPLVVVLAAATLGLAVPGRASAAFSWGICDGANGWIVKSFSVSPDPITGSGAALPFRWELTYDPATNAITGTEFDIGVPSDAASATGPLLRYPVAGNVVGSTTYTVTPSGLPVTQGNYSWSATVDGMSVGFAVTVIGDYGAADLGSVEVTLEKQVFGLWVEIPGVSIQSVQDLSFLEPGDYRMTTKLFNPNDSEVMCLQWSFTDGAGATAPIVLRPDYTFPFSGFFSPADNLPTVNTVKGGSSVPVKFSLGGNQGLSIFATGSPYSEKTSCDGGGTLDEIEETSTAGAGGLQYDAVTDTYTYVWKTEKSWANTCRTLHVKLSDGIDHVAWFKFR